MKVSILAASLTTLALASCSGGFCEECCPVPSRCQADPPASAAEIKACKEGPVSADGGKPRCLAEDVTVRNCMQSNQVCGKDNKTDAAATLAKCKLEHDAYTKCLAAP